MTIDIDALKRDKRPQSAWVVHALIDRLEAAEKERDALRSKIEAVEQQEPAAWTTKLALEYGASTLGFRVSSVNIWGEKGVPLYALPGAQPELNEIKIALQRALELSQRETWTGARKHRSREDQCEEQQCWNKVWSLLGAKGEEK